MERLDLIEREAQRLMEHRVATLELLKARAHTLAVFLFTAASAAVAFAITLLEKQQSPAIIAGVAALGVAWYIVGAIVVWRCIAPSLLPPVGHEPEAMMQDSDGVVVDEMRRGCLRSMQATQAAFAERSGKVGAWLTRGYYAGMLIAPAVAALVAFLWGRA